MLKPSLQLKLSQQLTMTPQLQQAIRLLQLPVMELQTQIQTALDENVMLEVEEPEASAEDGQSESAASESDDPEDFTDAADAPEPEVAVAAEADWEDTQKTGPSEAPKSADPRTTVEYADRSEETLRDHLLWQLELANLDARSTAIGQAIIDAINDDGYLTDDAETIRATLAPDVLVSIEDIEQVLVKLVQQFDPVGVGARSVSECVQLQLGQLGAETPGLDLARRIAAEHLPLVAEHQYGVLKRLLRASDSDIEAAIALVRACQPRPGANVFTAPPEYVVPDVFVRRHEGQWVVELNNSMSPQLRVNQLYAGSLGRGEEYDALKAQLQEARWLIRSLEIRNETLLKVALTIVQRQTEFLEQGEEFMRPMVLRDVAEAIEMHESTVSRVTTNKYMHTPRGVFEFRFFFSSHVAGDAGDQSSTAVRAKIRKLVSAEDPDKPLSDSQIAQMLSEGGVTVARRTVAKYREAMKIASSSDRKRSKSQ
ncbi:MAG TPA: RNA polymerase factor sigma-54 [Gammaproteobacteria bacterium]|nr:RNA polymerase factor sigma-54 [Gammaproteobacteria bacterium]